MKAMKQLRGKPMIQDRNHGVEDKKDVQQRIQAPGLARFRHNLDSRSRGRGPRDLPFPCRARFTPLPERAGRSPADRQSRARSEGLRSSTGSSGGMTIRSRHG